MPHADDRRFFYGANFEFSINAHRWDTTRFTSEIRPIIGWHLNPVDIIINPIVDTAYDGLGNLEFVPAARIAYNFQSGWALAAEEYADYGRFNDFASPHEQVHQLFAVVDRTWKGWDIEAGVGVGLTDASDRLTFKLILARDLNKTRYGWFGLLLRTRAPEHPDHAALVPLVAGVFVDRARRLLHREHAGERPASRSTDPRR